MSTFWNVLIVILLVLVIALALLYYFGQKAQKKQAAQQEQLEATRQVVSMLIIDKKRLETLDAVQALTGDLPLVLHGGTGIPTDMIKKAISLGVAKINVNTECQLAFAAATREYIEAGKDLEGKGFDPRKLLAPGFEAIKATVKEKMEIFGSIDKA